MKAPSTSPKSVIDNEDSLPGTLSDVIALADSKANKLSSDAPDFRFGFLRNITIEGVEPYLRFRLLNDGIRPSMNYSGYGSLKHDLLQPQSPLRKNKIDMLVTALMLEELDPTFGLPRWTAEMAQNELSNIFANL